MPSPPDEEHQQNETLVRKKWNLVKVAEKTSCEIYAIQFAEELGLLPASRKCRVHRTKMRRYCRNSEIGYFECQKGNCKGKRRISRATGTLFEQARIPVARVFFLMYCFSMQRSYEWVQGEDFTSPLHCISTSTIAYWYSHYRKIIIDHFIESCLEIGKTGGPGRVVQVDACKFESRKSNNDHQADCHWVLMVYDGSEDIRLEICTETELNSETLSLLIKKHIEPGTTVQMDFWKEGEFLSELGYIYKKGKPKPIDPHNPLDAEDSTNAQRNKLPWNSIKMSYIKDKCHVHNFSDWIIEFQWRRSIKKQNKDPFEELIKAIINMYGDFRTGQFSTD